MTLHGVGDIDNRAVNYNIYGYDIVPKRQNPHYLRGQLSKFHSINHLNFTMKNDQNTEKTKSFDHLNPLFLRERIVDASLYSKDDIELIRDQSKSVFNTLHFGACDDSTLDILFPVAVQGKGKYPPPPEYRINKKNQRMEKNWKYAATTNHSCETTRRSHSFSICIFPHWFRLYSSHIERFVN
ncbi:MAG: hypothetical protein GY786_12180 [Proteobacteria bacterium]|nr:hypothetical protein [Pseudomonadota bacterium]